MESGKIFPLGKSNACGQIVVALESLREIK